MSNANDVAGCVMPVWASMVAVIVLVWALNHGCGYALLAIAILSVVSARLAVRRIK